MLECRNVFGGFFAFRADLQQVKFENGNGIRQKFGERTIGVRTQLRLARVLKDVRQSPGNIREERIAPAGGGFGEFMRGIVKLDEIVARGLRLSWQSAIFPQILQALGGVLQKLVERIGIVGVHEPFPSAAGF